MRRGIVEHLGLSALLPVVRFAYGFALAAILSKYLSLADYGRWSLYMSSVFLVVTLSSANLMYAAAAILPPGHSRERRGDVFSIVVFRFMLTAIVYVGVGAYLVAGAVFPWSLVLSVGAVLAAVTLNDLVFGLLRAQLAVGRQVTFLAVQSGVALTTVAFAVYGLRASLYGTVIAYLFAEAAAAALGAFLLRDLLAWSSFNWSRLGRYLRVGLPLLPFALSDLIVNALVPFMIREFQSVEAVALYSIAQKVALVATIPGAVVGNVLVQYLRRGRQAAGWSGVRAGLRKFLLIYAALLIPALLGLVIFGRDLVEIVSTPEYGGTYPLMLVLCAVNVVLMITSMLSAAFAVYDRTVSIGHVWIAVLVGFVLLAAVALPRYSVMGVGFALLVAFSAGMIWIAVRVRSLGRQTEVPRERSLSRVKV